MSDILIKIQHFSGLPGYADGEMTQISQNDNRNELSIQPANFKRAGVLLKYDQITNVQITNELVTKEKNKSSVGRGLLGAALFGPTGAVVGAASGIGKKSKNKKQTMLVITYDSSSGSTNTLKFLIPAISDYSTFVSNLKGKIINKPSSGYL